MLFSFEHFEGCNFTINPQSPSVDTSSTSQSCLEQRFHRKIALMCGDRILYTATSEIVLRDSAIQSAIAIKNVGIGQIFKKLGLAPIFQLRGAGNSIHEPRFSSCSSSRVEAKLSYPLWLWREYALADSLGYCCCDHHNDGHYSHYHVKIL